MKYAKLGDIEIPAIALGTWSWGTGINGGNQIFGNSYGEEDLKPVFELAMKQGFLPQKEVGLELKHFLMKKPHHVVLKL